MLDDSDPPFYKWFTGGKLNVSHNCLDRHVEAGNGDRVAFHWHGEEGETRDISYADLHRDVQRFANALKDKGVQKGDVVGIYLPMIPEVAVAMLACARIGAVHNVVFGGFSAESVKERMEFSDAKLLITVDGARRKGKTAPIKQAVDECMPDLPCIVVQHTKADAPMAAKDAWFHEVVEAAGAECPAEPLDAEHPLYVLYTSGSTAKPKGILHTTGGYLTQVAWTHEHVFDLKPEQDVYWCSADVGWVTGHSYIVYGPLCNGATSVMYEGAPDYPHKGIWWELCERYGVTVFYTAPTAIRACMKWGVEHVDKSRPVQAAAAGHRRRADQPEGVALVPRSSSAASAARSSTPGGRRRPARSWSRRCRAPRRRSPASAARRCPASTSASLDEDGNEVGAGTQGLLAVRRAVAGDAAHAVQGRRALHRDVLLEVGRTTYLVGDAAKRDEDGYFWSSGASTTSSTSPATGCRPPRSSRRSSSHPKVAESAVIGQADEDTGQAIAAFVTLEGSYERSDELVDEIREHVAERIGKLARPKRIIWADDLPKTRSGKIMRRLLRDIAEGRELGDVTTLRDPDVMAQLETKIKERQAEGED